MLNRDEIWLGDHSFNSRTGELRDSQKNLLALRRKSTKVLSLLAERPGEIVEKSTLMESVWPSVTVSDENLTQCVADIRRTLGDKDQSLLVTHIGKGYSLQCAVKAPREMRRKGLSVAAALLMVLLVSGIWWILRPDPVPVERPRIAVLAFDDLSAGDNRGWLSDGIAEGIITELARYREFLVIARNSSFSFRHQPVDVTEISSKLKADYIVEGSKQKSGERLRVTVQLLDGQDGTHIWADEFNSEIAELFDVQSKIVRSVAIQIGQELTWNAPQSGGRDKVSALHFFLKANKQFKTKTQESRNQAVDLYRQSIAADPTAPFGYTGLATVIYSELANPLIYTDVPRGELLRRGFEYAEMAIDADPNYDGSHIALGDLYSRAGNQKEAINSYLRAAELNPSNAVAIAVVSEPLLYLDRADEAIETMERAFEVNPVAPNWYYNYLSRALWWAGRCEEGLKVAKDVPRIRTWDYRAQIMNLVCLDRIDEARDVGQKLLKLDPGFTVSEHGRRIEGIINFPKYQKRWLDSLRAAGLPEV
ncbi:MAG: winged helix-turn-helix domain-containing protein [Rhizobiaceae bacterium]